jgi:hypothetical protein
MSGSVLGVDADFDLDDIGDTSLQATSMLPIAGWGSCSMLSMLLGSIPVLDIGVRT